MKKDIWNKKDFTFQRKLIVAMALLCFTCLHKLSAQTDTIPFVLTEFNNILVESILNEDDTLMLMFHTAVNSVSLTQDAVTKLKNKKDLLETEVESWGGKSQTDYSENNTLQIGSFKMDSLTIWNGELSGKQSDGKFGPDFFGASIIEIDFENQHLIIHNDLPTLTGFSVLKIHRNLGSMFLQGSCFNGEESHEQKFMMHTGYGGTILLDNEFASRSKMARLEVIDESELRDSYGNVLKKKKAILPGFTLAQYEFEDMPMGFFEGTIGNQKVSVIGTELLKRFQIIIDQKNGKVHLKPNVLMNKEIVGQ